MFTDWTHWLSSLSPEELLALFCALFLVDAPRYALSKLCILIWDMGGAVWAWLRGLPDQEQYSYCPPICVVLVGYNEAETVEATLQSIWSTYPKMEIVVVDDGSQDRMSDVARRFGKAHPGVLVLVKPQRGGKSSALNFALQYSQAEVIVTIDADSHISRSALWEIVQPLEDPQVGAVSATVLARNPFTNLVTWLQAYEYLHTIFMGRMFSARMGILGIVSGAFGAFRRSAIQQVMGWDVGPGEDGDLVLRVRKAGYKIAFAQYAQCYSNVPTSWWSLLKQRRRWEWAVVTFECRKHIDLAFFWTPNFRFSNLCLVLDRWIFNILLMYVFWAYLIWLCFYAHPDIWKVLGTIYLFYVGFELLQVISLLFYSNSPVRDAIICMVMPLAPFYHIYLKAASLIAVTEELIFRRSFEDNFVPSRVRDATWHW